MRHADRSNYSGEIPRLVLPRLLGTVLRPTDPYQRSGVDGRLYGSYPETAFWKAASWRKFSLFSRNDLRVQRCKQIRLPYERSENPKLQPPATN